LIHLQGVGGAQMQWMNLGLPSQHKQSAQKRTGGIYVVIEDSYSFCAFVHHQSLVHQIRPPKKKWDFLHKTQE
jgi:hypothetical protein